MTLRASLLTAVAAIAIAALALDGHARPVAGCTGPATKALIRQFVADYGAGRVAAAMEPWAPSPRFKWFSTGAPGSRLRSASMRRGTLQPYFRSRVREHERLVISALRARFDPHQRLVHFSGMLIRTADDVRGRPGP